MKTICVILIGFAAMFGAILSPPSVFLGGMATVFVFVLGMLASFIGIVWSMLDSDADRELVKARTRIIGRRGA